MALRPAPAAAQAQQRAVYASVLNAETGAPVEGLGPADVIIHEDVFTREVLKVAPDSGRFEPEGDPETALKNGRLNFSLNGKKLKGGFALVLMKGRGSGKDWLLIKRSDSFAGADWKIKQDLTPARKKKLVEKAPPCETS